MEGKGVGGNGVGVVGVGSTLGTETALPIEPGTGGAGIKGSFNASAIGSGSGAGSGSAIGSVAAMV